MHWTELHSYKLPADMRKAECGLRGCSVSWRRIVLDEAQQIRSHNTLGAVACSLLQVRQTHSDGNQSVTLPYLCCAVAARAAQHIPSPCCGGRTQQSYHVCAAVKPTSGLQSAVAQLAMLQVSAPHVARPLQKSVLVATSCPCLHVPITTCHLGRATPISSACEPAASFLLYDMI